MEIIDTNIPDVKLLQPKVFGDDRGYFMETYRDEWFKSQIANVDFVQDNHSKSTQGVLRGLHYQIKQSQGKLVRVLAGEVFDVAVDLRQSSPSFGHWTGHILSEENKQLMWVPAGFAHGFLVLSESAEFIYKCTDYYAPEYERSLIWNDSEIGINWPEMSGGLKLSEKDLNGKAFKDCEVFA